METKYIPYPRLLSNFRVFSIEFALCTIYLLYTLLFHAGMLGIQIAVLVVLFGVSLYFCLLHFYRGYHEKLLISPAGIRHTAFGYEVFTSWSNLKRIGKLGRSKYEGVYASYQPDDVHMWLKGMPIGQEIFIPLSIFADNWRDSELGQQIKQYAPQLFL